jgi:hypothetical protein
MTSTVVITREEEAQVPEGRPMVVDVADWTRIRENVENLGDPLTDRASTWGAVAIGAAIAVVGVIATVELGSTKPAAGLRTGLWVAFAFCFLIAALFFRVGQTEKKRYGVSNRAICDDMDAVAERGGARGAGVRAATSRLGVRSRMRLWLKGDPRISPDGNHDVT